MKVFLSWSGPRSKFIADALRWWLPLVIQSVKPWMSDEDISAGSPWLNTVFAALSDTQFGIICATPENQTNLWLLFETGALAKSISSAYVCPFLIDLTHSQLTGPLSHFQAIQANFDGTSKIVSTLNRLLGAAQIPEDALKQTFNMWWPKLAESIQNLPSIGETVSRRTNDELLEELITNTREQLRRGKSAN